MKNLKVSILILCACAFSLLPLVAHAKSYQMIFWYPGEAGSTLEARSTLETFFRYLNIYTEPERINGVYFNTVADGAEFVRTAQPKFLIVSYPASVQQKDILKDYQPMLRTLTFPEGASVETYVIVGKGGSPASLKTVPLYTKQPLTSGFVAEHLLGEKAAGVGLKIETVANIIPTLKDIASGAKQGGAILQPMEYFTLKRMEQPWVKDITVWKTVGNIPSPPVLVLNGVNDKISKQVRDVLLTMSRSSQGRLILETLRLKGFAPVP